MRLSKSQRIKVALAVPYCLWWLVTGGFYCRPESFLGLSEIHCWFITSPTEINNAAYPPVFQGYRTTFIWHFVPLVLLFATDIWRWIKAGNDK